MKAVGPGTRDWVFAIVAVAMAATVAGLEWYLISAVDGDPLWDLAVYRGAVQHWLDGGDLYGYLLPHPARPSGFPFTYPPFAAIVLAPLAWLPQIVADNAWTLASFVVTAAMATFLVRRAPRTPDTWLSLQPSTARVTGLSALATLALLLTFPGVHNLVLGQISFAIAAMMLFDIGGAVPARARGVLSGLAAAIKLTPLIALPYFLVTRQLRAAGAAAIAFLTATGLAAAVYWAGSTDYWAHRIFETDRVGDPATIQNKSILGLLARWHLGGDLQPVVWLALIAIVGAVALMQARRQFLVGQEVAAALIVGCAAVAVSPVSWPHHQVWGVLVGVWLLLMRRPGYLVLGALLLAMNFVGSPFIGQEVVPLGTDDPILLALGRDLPTLSFVAVCVLGLPIRAAREGSPLRPALPVGA